MWVSQGLQRIWNRMFRSNLDGNTSLCWWWWLIAKVISQGRLLPFICRCIRIPLSLFEYTILCFLESCCGFFGSHAVFDPKFGPHVKHRDVVFVFVKPFLMFRVCDVYLLQIMRKLFANLNQNILWVDTMRPRWWVQIIGSCIWWQDNQSSHLHFVT